MADEEKGFFECVTPDDKLRDFTRKFSASWQAVEPKVRVMEENQKWYEGYQWETKLALSARGDHNEKPVINTVFTVIETALPLCLDFKAIPNMDVFIDDSERKDRIVKMYNTYLRYWWWKIRGDAVGEKAMKSALLHPLAYVMAVPVYDAVYHKGGEIKLYNKTLRDIVPSPEADEIEAWEYFTDCSYMTGSVIKKNFKDKDGHPLDIGRTFENKNTFPYWCNYLPGDNTDGRSFSTDAGNLGGSATRRDVPTMTGDNASTGAWVFRMFCRDMSLMYATEPAREEYDETYTDEFGQEQTRQAAGTRPVMDEAGNQVMHKRPIMLWPKGVIRTFINGKWVDDRNNYHPLGYWPVASLGNYVNVYKDKMYCMDEIQNLKQLNLTTNKLWARILDWIGKAVIPVVVSPNDVEIDPRIFTPSPGGSVFYDPYRQNANIPQFSRPQDIPMGLFKAVDMIMSFSDLESGQHDSSRGKASPSIDSGKEVLTLLEAAQTRIRPKIKHYHQFIEDICRIVVPMFDYYSFKKRYALVNGDNAEFDPSMLKTNGEFIEHELRMESQDISITKREHLINFALRMMEMTPGLIQNGDEPILTSEEFMTMIDPLPEKATRLRRVRDAKREKQQAAIDQTALQALSDANNAATAGMNMIHQAGAEHAMNASRINSMQAIPQGAPAQPTKGGGE